MGCGVPGEAPGDMGRWLQHQRIARIMAAARAEALGERVGDEAWKPYFWERLYAPDGAEFKLNLFPLPAQLDGLTPWSKVFRGQPELVPRIVTWNCAGVARVFAC